MVRFKPTHAQIIASPETAGSVSGFSLETDHTWVLARTPPRGRSTGANFLFKKKKMFKGLNKKLPKVLVCRGLRGFLLFLFWNFSMGYLFKKRS